MRGFRERASVESVIALIDARVRNLSHEPVPLLEAGGRVLARDAHAMTNVPAFPRAAMDGYAVRAEETFGAAEGDSLRLEVRGECLPGRAPDASVDPGTCVRIMTGAPLPPGADAVVPFEQTAPDGDHALIKGAVTPGKNVGAIGEDIEKGATVLRAGRRLKPQDLGVLSSLGYARISCVRRPRVGLVVTGAELLPPGATPEGFAIVDANTPMLIELVKRDGGTLLAGPIVKDDRDALREAIQVCAAQTECVLIAGGSSVGRKDHAPSLIRELGELPVHGVAMRPSSPAGAGFLGDTPAFLLPGNPVSCLCAYEFFAGRAIRRLAGRSPRWPHTTVRMPLAKKIASELGRTDYVRVRIEGARVIPIAIRGASILSSTTRAHGFVIVPADAEGHAEGDPVDVRLY
ncbi:MAG: molybdopterin molybdotransferase MoeA [Planctomycetota bacterium]|nr:molybdopterin molybdotransferase MoeA [Planctomycetota bacterium]